MIVTVAVCLAYAVCVVCQLMGWRWLLMRPLRRNRVCLALFSIILTLLLLIYSPAINQLEIVYIEHLPLNRQPLLKEPLIANHSRLIISTCNERADQRGPHQKVIAYSVYGDFTQMDVSRRYLKPLVETTKKIVHIYPEWVIRIYHNLTNDDKSWRLFQNTFQEAGSHIDLCNATQIIHDRELGNIFSMTWRWLPLLDDLVDTFMSRDADSPIISREEDAVREWLSGDRIFHIMRDHPRHCVYILGGLWGVKLDRKRPKFAKVAKRMLKRNHLHEYDYDQTLLTRHMWPIARTNMVAHDSYCCQYFPPTSPFPTLRIGGAFVGMVGNLPTNDNSTAAECPQQCRPKNASSDWRFC